MKNFIKEIIIILGKDFKYLWIMAIFFMLLSILDIIGISLIYPYISIITEPSKFVSSDIYTFINRHLSFNSLNQLFIIIGLTLICLFILKALAGIFINRLILKFGLGQGNKLRAELMNSYQNLDYRNFTDRNTSEYIYNIFHLANQYSQTVLVSMLRILSEGTVALAILIFLAFSNFLVFVVLILVLGSLMFVFDFFFKNKMIRYGSETNMESNNMLRAVNESMHGIKTIRILGISNFFYNNLSKASKNFSQALLNQLTISQSPKYVIEAALIFLIVIIFIVSSSLLKEEMSLIPTLSMFGVAGIRLIPSINQLISCVSHLRYSRDGIKILTNDLIKLRNFEEKIKSRLSSEDEIINIKKFESLELKNIIFSYNKKSKVNLNGISLKIKRGDFIGIMGPSGSGKTTLVDVMLGLLSPDEGQIFVNNINTKVSNNFFISKVAYLPQQAFIIDGSVKENVALGIKKNEINEKKVIISLDKAKLTSTISEMINGINTEIGENGIKLSGGQKQRIALARAFYHDREFIILDESTSALDNQIENEIINELNLLKKSVTLLMIAHRRSTLQNCDRIINIKDGKLLN
ncbi:ATP-binding cassette domain-containing protein [Candidatus Pelagibacter sp.]|nr:ATP-binding cassette domain-containing protein [Candidatus Pelagibacter sp.]